MGAGSDPNFNLGPMRKQRAGSRSCGRSRQTFSSARCVASSARSVSRRILCATAWSRSPTATARLVKAPSSPCCARVTSSVSMPHPHPAPVIPAHSLGMGTLGDATTQFPVAPLDGRDLPRGVFARRMKSRGLRPSRVTSFGRRMPRHRKRRIGAVLFSRRIGVPDSIFGSGPRQLGWERVVRSHCSGGRRHGRLFEALADDVAVRIALNGIRHPAALEPWAEHWNPQQRPSDHAARL